MLNAYIVQVLSTYYPKFKINPNYLTELRMHRYFCFPNFKIKNRKIYFQQSQNT